MARFRKFSIPYNELLFYGIMFLPLWMWLAWLLSPKSKLVVAIVDKTVFNTEAQEHSSLNWVLRNEKYSKTSKELYKMERDYFGFFPKKNEEYDLKGLERFSNTQLDKLSKDCDLMYITDTYGIYSNEWNAKKSQSQQQMLYGGLSKQDMYLLKRIKEQKKLIITEFNTFATPTPPVVAREFEQTFKMQWTGWVGKYFDSLDTLQNKELPRWLIENYKRDHNNKWPFKKAGIVFVHKSEKQVILEYVTHLNSEVPSIVTPKKHRERLNIPKEMKYSFWFDVVRTSRKNQIVSFYNIKANRRGMKMLEENGIPPQFPAVIEHYKPEYKFYYFAGDFADNPISQAGSYFKGIKYFRKMFYNDDIAAERVSFFWEFYAPLVTSILNRYEEELNVN